MLHLIQKEASATEINQNPHSELLDEKPKEPKVLQLNIYNMYNLYRALQFLFAVALQVSPAKSLLPGHERRLQRARAVAFHLEVAGREA